MFLQRSQRHLVWQKIANVYFFDQQVFNQFDKEQQQIIAGILYQAHERGMVRFNSDEIRSLENFLGIAGSPTSLVPGTPRSPGQPRTPTGQVGSTPGYIGSPETGSQAGSPGMVRATATGAASAGPGKVYEVSKAGGAPKASSGPLIYTIARIMILVALVGAGYFLAGRGKT